MLPRLVILASKKGRETYIDDVASKLSVKPTNIFRVSPEDATLSIDQMRQLSSLFLTQSPDIRIIVIDSIDLATVEAQNSILKLLEEKTEKTQFILFTGQPESVLPTIRSRTLVLFPEGKNTTGKVEKDISGLADDLAKGPPNLNSNDHMLKTKEEVLNRIDQYVYYYKQLLIANPSRANTAILQKLLSTKKEIQAANVNPQFAYDILLIFISELASMK